MELTTENIAKLIEWQKDGRRCVDIKIDNIAQLVWEDRPTRIWCYDYDVQEGASIQELSELPTTAMLKRQAVTAMEEKLSRMKEE